MHCLWRLGCCGEHYQINLAQLLVTTSIVVLEASKELLKLDSRAIKITRAFVNRQPVSVLSVQEMDALHPGWQFD